jgi:hypothetical protein
VEVGRSCSVHHWYAVTASSHRSRAQTYRIWQLPYLLPVITYSSVVLALFSVNSHTALATGPILDGGYRRDWLCFSCLETLPAQGCHNLVTKNVGRISIVRRLERSRKG